MGLPLERVPFVSGLMFSLSAGAGALGNTLCAVWLRRVTASTILRAAAAVAAMAALAFAFVPRVGVLYLAATLFGLAIGSGLTAAYTAGGAVVPTSARGAGFGVLSSAYLAALAISPVVAGVLGHFSIAAVFVLDAAVLAAVGMAVARVMVTTPGRTAAPATEEI
jgi:MFS family permease